MLYVDKTDYVWKLTQRYRYVFLSRPRRFGKSLFLSTLQAYFEGRRELFEGTFLYGQEKEWRKHPVVRMDFSKIGYSDGGLESELKEILRKLYQHHEIDWIEASPGLQLATLLDELVAKFGSVVLLVDEYDRAMVNVLHLPKRFEKNRQVLGEFLAAVKSVHEGLRFVFLTGISRFSKVNIFSGLNNLTDISLLSDFSGIVGFRQSQLEEAFEPYFSRLYTAYGYSRNELLDALRELYNGYSWDGNERVYNPHSVLHAMNSGVLDDYWFSSATPAFLYQSIQREKLNPDDYLDISTLDVTGFARPDGTVPIIPLLFQTGYLTIDRITHLGRQRYYHLRYPNEEVSRAFLTLVAAAITDVNVEDIDHRNLQLQEALAEHDLLRFFAVLQSYISEIPYQLHQKNEAFYHALVYMLLRAVGVKMEMEKSVAGGRIDGVLPVSERTYLFEFKFAKQGDARPETLSRRALEQIDENDYFAPYRGTTEQVTAVGVGFVEQELHGRWRDL